MCRWMAWLGQPVLVEELLFNTQHGIVDQSLHSRDGGGDDERRRVRPRLVRRGRRPGALPQRRAGLGGREPARARRPRRVAAVPRPRPRRDRLARAADELPPVPPPQLALRPQRLRGQPPRAPARPDARHRPRALRRRQRLDRHRGRLPARAHARARGGPDRRDGADRRPHRGDRPRRTGCPASSRARSASRTATRCGPSATRPRAPRARCSRRPTSTRSTGCIPTTRS